MSNFAQCGFANGVPLADLSSYVGAGSDLPLGAGAWVKGTYAYTGTFSVSAAGRIYQISSTASAWYTAAVAPPTANYTVQADFVYLTSATDSLGLLARAGVDSSYGTISGYYLRHQTTVGFALVLFSNGGSTTLSAIGHEVTSGTVTAQLQVQGSTITVYLGGVQVYQTTDSTISAAGFAGVYSGPSAVTSTTGLHLANFAAAPAVVVDTTPPVVASSAIASNGTSFSIVFTETGSPPVLPASGVTGLTLTASGGAVTIGSPTISGTTLSGTLSRTVYVGETVTLAYTPGNITDSATTPNALITFSGTSVTNSSTQVPGTFTVTETALPSNHGSGTITVHLVGTGTAWTSGTAFLVAGVSGWSVSSKTNVDGTHYTVVLGCPAAASPPAGATGTLTITDTTDSISATTTVGTPTLAISPTSGNISTTPTMTMTGTNSLWTTETPTGLFTVSGGTGASFATPTVTTNTAASDVLTVGSATGTLTITCTTNGAQAPFTATAPALVAGTASFVSSGSGGIGVTSGAPTGGTGAGPTYQWQSSINGGTTWTNLTGATTLSWTDATATTTGITYQYCCQQTKGSNTVITNAITAEVYLGGSFTLPGYPSIGSVLSGVGYGASVNEFVGTLVLPTVGQVQTGVNYGSGGTQYTGTLAGFTLAQLQTELTTRGLTSSLATIITTNLDTNIGSRQATGSVTVSSVANNAITTASFASGTYVPANFLQWNGGSLPSTTTSVDSNVTKISGQTVTAPSSGGVAFSGTVGDSTYDGGPVASVIAGVTLDSSQHVIVDSGSVTYVTSPVNVNLSQAGLSPRNLRGIPDNQLTVGDGIISAISSAAGLAQAGPGTFTLQTPAGSTLMDFVITLDGFGNAISRG